MSSRLSVGDWPLATTNSPWLDNSNCQAAASIGDTLAREISNLIEAQAV